MAIFLLRLAVDLAWYLAIVLPVIAAVPAPVRAALVVLPCVYAVPEAVKWKKAVNSADLAGYCSQIQDRFLFQAKLLIPVLVLHLFIMRRADWERESAPFLAAFLVLGVLLLRISRVPESGRRDPVFYRKNAGYLAAAAAAALLLSTKTVRAGAVAVIAGIYNGVVLPLIVAALQALLWLVELVAPFFSRFFHALGDVVPDAEKTEIVTGGGTGFDTTPLEVPMVLKVLFWLAVAIAAAVILYALYRKLRTEQWEQRDQTQGSVSRENVAGAGRRPEGEGGFSFLEKRDVRHYYRKFLKLCRERGLPLDGRATSGRICEAAKGCWDGKSLTELRDLYRRARYGSGETENARSRDRAKEILRDLKEENSGASKSASQS